MGEFGDLHKDYLCLIILLQRPQNKDCGIEQTLSTYFKISVMCVSEASRVPPDSTPRYPQSYLGSLEAVEDWELLLPLEPYVTTFSRHWDPPAVTLPTGPISLFLLVLLGSQYIED